MILRQTGQVSSWNYLGYCDVDLNSDKVPASRRSDDAGIGASNNTTSGFVHDMGWSCRI